jgi:hypothetical protein
VLTLGFVLQGFVATTKQYAHFAVGQREAQLAALSSRGLSTARHLGDAMHAPLLNGDIDVVNDAMLSVTRGGTGSSKGGARDPSPGASSLASSSADCAISVTCTESIS